jgi:hypothetical protein
MSSVFLTSSEQIPGESFLMSCLQKRLVFCINSKVIKRGKLLLFRKSHYFIQFTILTEKGTKENMDIPFPFKCEDYSDEGLMYFDYRVESLQLENLPKIPFKVASIYFNKILEIQTF